jgi:hypothetical protein
MPLSNAEIPTHIQDRSFYHTARLLYLFSNNNFTPASDIYNKTNSTTHLNSDRSLLITPTLGLTITNSVSLH